MHGTSGIGVSTPWCAPLSTVFPINLDAYYDAISPAGGGDEAAFVDGLVADRAPPRDLDLVCAFLAAHPPRGRVFIYGAGTQGRAMAKVLTGLPGVELAGFVDARAENIEQFGGLPVIAPEALAGQCFDQVLLAHFSKEKRMAERLVAAGIDASRLRPVFSEPGYGAWALPRIRADFRAGLPPACDACIVSTAGLGHAILPAADLRQVLPAATVNLFYGRAQSFLASFDDDSFPVVDCLQSLALLEEAVRLLAPRLIYLRSSAHTEGQYLTAFFQARFPGIVLVNEIYDWSVLFEDGGLCHRYDLSRDDLARARFGEAVASRHARFVLSKNGGAAWENLVESFGAAHCGYFPQLLPSTAYSPACAVEDRDDNDHSTGRVRIIFAGSLPPSERVGGRAQHPDMHYLDHFEILAASGLVTIDIYNAMHVDAASDAVYADYLGAFGGADSAIRYHRAIPLPELLMRMSDYDFGWHSSHLPDDPQEQIDRVVVANKMTGYISGGLPVILDDCYDYMGELLTRFEAGIIIRPADMAALPDRLAALDRRRLKAGARALYAHMAAANTTALGTLESVVQRAVLDPLVHEPTPYDQKETR